MPVAAAVGEATEAVSDLQVQTNKLSNDQTRKGYAVSMTFAHESNASKAQIDASSLFLYILYIPGKHDCQPSSLVGSSLAGRPGGSGGRHVAPAHAVAAGSVCWGRARPALEPIAAPALVRVVGPASRRNVALITFIPLEQAYIFRIEHPANCPHMISYCVALSRR